METTIDALAIGAHPDDAEFGAGGTLLRLSSLGYTTGILDMTRGELGTRGTADERALEAEAAGRALNLTYRGTLDLGDGHVRDTEEARSKLVEALRRLRPKIVFTHYWEQPHPDHVATAALVRQTAYLAGLAKYDGESGLERHRPNAIAHFGLPRWETPTFVVDISEWAEQKKIAIACHRSQLHDPNRDELQTSLSTAEFLEWLDSRHRFYGGLIQSKFGEAFIVKEALNVEDPVRLLSRPMDLFY